jgi:hypothetical protein
VSKESLEIEWILWREGLIPLEVVSLSLREPSPVVAIWTLRAFAISLIGMTVAASRVPAGDLLPVLVSCFILSLYFSIMSIVDVRLYLVKLATHIEAKDLVREKAMLRELAPDEGDRRALSLILWARSRSVDDER